jgi:hypothetical protein
MQDVHTCSVVEGKNAMLVKTKGRREPALPGLRPERRRRHELMHAYFYHANLRLRGEDASANLRTCGENR